MEAAISMLSCARIGAVHSVVFAGFSSEAVGERIRDSGAKVVITADGGMRGGKPVALKKVWRGGRRGQKNERERDEGKRERVRNGRCDIYLTDRNHEHELYSPPPPPPRPHPSTFVLLFM